MVPYSGSFPSLLSAPGTASQLSKSAPGRETQCLSNTECAKSMRKVRQQSGRPVLEKYTVRGRRQIGDNFARHDRADRAHMEKKLKLVVVGDSFVGKTNLLFAYTEKKFLENCATTVFDNWAINVTIEQRNYTVNLFDTAGQEDYESLRCLSYPNTDVFILCFSLVERKSLDACRTVWLPEIRKYAGDEVPVILVGTKEDLVETTSEKERVSLDAVRRAAQEMGCVKFFTCSSLTHRGLKRVFDEAFLTAIGIQVTEEEVKPCCSLM